MSRLMSPKIDARTVDSVVVSLGFAEDAVVAVAEVLVSEGCDFSVVAVALLVSAVVVVSWGTVVVSLEDTVVCVLLSVVPGFDSEVVTPLSGRPEMVNFTDTDLETLTFDAISETLLVGVHVFRML